MKSAIALALASLALCWAAVGTAESSKPTKLNSNQSTIVSDQGRNSAAEIAAYDAFAMQINSVLQFKPAAAAGCKGDAPKCGGHGAVCCGSEWRCCGTACPACGW
jgi:hypothetical protein